mmetsp:Transcript_104702/g.291617  ORF Transcript_104702/g.291617 Transcript_104702/m.291617 type:complete len:641 (-) Transcript_104702:65-1987(-)
MPVYTHQAMDKMSGFQQGLEASMARHKEELSQKFGARLAHACREAEDAACQRVQAAYEPRLQALEEQLQAHIGESRSHAERALRDVSDLVGRHTGAAEDIAALNTRARSTAERLEDFARQLEAECRQREASCQDLDGRVFELQASIVKEGMSREEADEKLDGRLNGACAEAAAATQQAVATAEEKLRLVSEEAAALEARMQQRLEEEAAQCIRQAARHSEEEAGRVREELGHATQRAQQQVDEARAHAEALVEASEASLRSEQAVAADHILVASEQAGKEQANRVSAQLHHELEQSGRDAARANADATAALWEAVATLEGRVADARHSCSSELQHLANGETLRLHFLNALQVRHGQPGAFHDGLSGTAQGGGRTRVVDSELTRTNPHVRKTLEVGLQEDILELKEALADMDRRLCQERDRLDAELRARATNHEVYTRLQATVTDLSSRCCAAQSEVCETRVRSQQELLALGGEVTELRAALASLASGVVRALQVLGLLEAAPSLGTPLVTPRAVAARGAQGMEQPGGPSEAPQATPQGGSKGVRVEDLLQWERAGNSLTAKVSRQWRGREATGMPTFLAALDRLLQADERAAGGERVALRHPFVHPVAAPPVAPPLAPVKGAPPPGLAAVRHQRLAAAMI